MFKTKKVWDKIELSSEGTDLKNLFTKDEFSEWKKQTVSSLENQISLLKESWVKENLEYIPNVESQIETIKKL